MFIKPWHFIAIVIMLLFTVVSTVRNMKTFQVNDHLFTV